VYVSSHLIGQLAPVLSASGFSVWQIHSFVLGRIPTAPNSPFPAHISKHSVQLVSKFPNSSSSS